MRAFRTPTIARALGHRNYRLFFSGQIVSLTGSWITRIATSWLVYRLTGSPLLLGLVGFAGQIPTLVMAPFTGVLVDRWNRHRILVITQTLSMLQSLALAVLALAHVITVTEILALQLAQGMINAFDTPARQAFVIQMVDDRNDLSNAIALNSTMVNASRIVGPAIGGMLIAAFGEGWCFLVDAVSYFAVIVSLIAMRVSRERPPRASTHLLEELRDGFRYVSGSAPMRGVLLLLALVSTMGMPYMVLMPAVASKILHGGPHTLGFLMTAAGVGALCGALYLASRTSVVGLGRVIAVAACTFGAGIVAFSLSRALWLSLLLLPLAGAGLMVTMASTNTLLQTLVEERMRGRVMAFYAMSFQGTAPIGSLIAGFVAERIGVPATLMLGGTACVLGGGAFALWLPRFRAHVRPIYIARGILPPTGPAPAA
ncbi:MAG TPA: MFS transporter [Gemmatimonadaceae bacterium]|nr:MFS transporter [Gemmatimonadaceae bacterium]